MEKKNDDLKKKLLDQKEKHKKLRTLKTKQNQKSKKIFAENLQLKKTVKKQKSEITKIHLARMKLNLRVRAAKGADTKIGREKLIRQALDGVLTKAQMDRVLLGKKSHWSPDDIMTSTVLLSHSSRAYRFLREEMKMPLPAISTIKAHVAKLPVETGILKAAILLMSARAKCMSELHRVCSLSFDEMHICGDFVYDSKEDKVLGGKGKTQVVMARGLFAPWKNPVFFDHNQPMTVSILSEVIDALHDAGFEVVSIVSDMGGDNIRLYGELDVTHEHPYFLHEKSGHKIACFHDAPHLLKLARNHLLDEGLVLNPDNPSSSREEACLEPLLQLINGALGEDVSVHRLTKFHLTCYGSDRQIVRLAAQVLSLRTAVALENAGRNNMIKSKHYLVKKM